MTDPATLKGICDGVDTVITTVGLTKTSATLNNYQIDSIYKQALQNHATPTLVVSTSENCFSDSSSSFHENS